MEVERPSYCSHRRGRELIGSQVGRMDGWIDGCLGCGLIWGAVEKGAGRKVGLDEEEWGLVCCAAITFLHIVSVMCGLATNC